MCKARTLVLVTLRWLLLAAESLQRLYLRNAQCLCLLLSRGTSLGTSGGGWGGGRIWEGWGNTINAFLQMGLMNSAPE